MLKEQKAAARTAAFAARKGAHGTGLDEAANKSLTGVIEKLPDVRVVAGYMPMRTEVSPLPTMTILYGQEKRICVPVIRGRGQPLEFHEWEPGAEMEEGPFGAHVPKSGQVLVPDVVIVPLLAFDRAGMRLGYGGGFYDRTLAQLAGAGSLRAIGYAYSAQEVERVPAEQTDWPLPQIVTEHGAIRI